MISSTTNLNCTTIILAGGKSSRMGQDKALLSLNGVPMLRQVCEVAIACTTKVYLVTPWPERYQAVIPNSIEVICEQLLPGSTEPQGPLVAFTQGLAQVKSEWVLLLACDLPCLRVDVLRASLDLLETVAPQAIALVPKEGENWQPLCGYYRRCCLPLLTAFIERGGRSFQRWLNSNLVQELPMSDRTILFNCNTPEDLAKIKQETDG